MSETDESEKPSGRAKGGIAAAQALTPQQRVDRGKRGAAARWGGVAGLPRATHEGVLIVGDSEIPCYVLENGERVLSTRGIMKSLGRTWRGRKYTGTELPVFLEAKNLKPFINSELSSVLTPVEFRTPRGAKGQGFKAEVLPTVCDVYLQAREAGALAEPQIVIARKCEILVRALSKVGIIALVDEATGFQEVRDKQALQAILDAYLRKELAAWAKAFPDEFYQQIFRLRGWEWKGRRTNPPQVVAHYTKDIVYARLAPQILDELEKRNPMENGKRRGKHHQWLTDDVGHPALAQHLHAVVTLMRVSRSWDQFKEMLDLAHPRRNDTLSLPLMIEPPMALELANDASSAPSQLPLLSEPAASSTEPQP